MIFTGPFLPSKSFSVSLAVLSDITLFKICVQLSIKAVGREEFSD